MTQNKINRCRFPQWCKDNDIPVSTGYLLLKQGKGPHTFKVGRARFVSDEADREWQARMEAEQSPKEVTISITGITNNNSLKDLVNQLDALNR
jgi:hypothetical protein